VTKFFGPLLIWRLFPRVWSKVGLALLAAGLFFVRLWPVSSTRLLARVELAGKPIREIDLERFNGKIVTVKIPKGKVKLEVKAGAISICQMLPPEICPRKICSHAGWIRRSGETIICVPNRLLIRLVGSQTSVVDVVAR
jgi:hypothetical protein